MFQALVVMRCKGDPRAVSPLYLHDLPWCLSHPKPNHGKPIYTCLRHVPVLPPPLASPHRWLTPYLQHATVCPHPCTESIRQSQRRCSGEPSEHSYSCDVRGSGSCGSAVRPQPGRCHTCGDLGRRVWRGAIRLHQRCLLLDLRRLAVVGFKCRAG